jgi:hypothetical protein
MDMLKIIMGWLGYISKSDSAQAYDTLKKEAEEMKRLNNQYARHCSEVYLYCGNYPNWKAQQELRELWVSIIDGDPMYDKFSTLDNYLSRVVDSTKLLIDAEGRHYDSGFWSEKLSVARGDDHKKKIVAAGKPFISQYDESLLNKPKA